MGYDDGVCEAAEDGQHEFELVEVVSAGAGLAQLHECSWCGATYYEASAADDPRRPPR